MSKDSLFPIVEVDHHKLIAVDSNVGYFYEVFHPDLEQLDDRELDNFFNSLSVGLNDLPSEFYYKFYWFNRQAYLETNSSEILELPSLRLNPCSDHLRLFFKADDFLSDVKIFEDYMHMANRSLKLVSVTGFSETPFNFQDLPIDFDYVLKLRKIDHSKAVSKLDDIRKSHQASFLKSRTDFEGSGAYEEAEGLMSDLVHGDECLFEMELTFVVDSFLEGLLQKNVQDLVRGLKRIGASPYIEGASFKKRKSGFFKVFNELVPGVRPNFSNRMLTNKTSHLINLLPLRKSCLSTKGVSFEDRNYQEIFFNPFDSKFKNKNMLVTGASGTGKSVFVNKLVDSLVDEHPTVILDKGGSFKLLTEYHDGCELVSHINPMQFKDPSFLREFILSVVDKDKFDKLEQGRLLKEIKSYLTQEDISFNGLLRYLENTFGDVSLYFEGIKDHLSEDDISFTPILYVDINNFPQEMISPIILFVLQYFKEYPASEKILVFDECWSFLVNHGNYIDECFRVFRKSGAFPISISQGIEDFKQISEKLSNSITNNSYFKVFFPQELEVSSEITEFDKERVNSLGHVKGSYSECYLKSSDNEIKKVLVNVLSNRQLEVFNTEPNQRERLSLFLENNARYFKSSKEAIDAYVGLIYGNFKDDFDDPKSYLWRKSVNTVHA